VPALRELQRAFAHALFTDASGPELALIAAAPSERAGRFDIYRNNVHVGFLKALAIGFPVIERLVGANYFSQLAEQFLGAHPSRAGNLHHIGEPFPDFLRKKFGATEYAYLADVAALEWAREEVLIAADEPAIEVSTLREVSPSTYDDIRFDVHAAARLVRSDYPVTAIWRTNQSESSSDEVVDLRSGGENVLVLRATDCIEFHRLPAGDFAALRAFAAGFPLGTALEAALAADPTFDLASALHRFFRLNLFTAISAPRT
jgi:hypothetical protein